MAAAFAAMRCLPIALVHVIFLGTSTMVPPAFSIFSLAEAENSSALTVSGIDKSPVPRICQDIKLPQATSLNAAGLPTLSRMWGSRVYLERKLGGLARDIENLFLFQRLQGYLLMILEDSQLLKIDGHKIWYASRHACRGPCPNSAWKVSSKRK